jgi:hypothetical protein
MCKWVVSCPYCQSYNIDDLGNRLSADSRETIWDFICVDCDLAFEAIEPDDDKADDPPGAIDIDIDVDRPASDIWQSNDMAR